VISKCYTPIILFLVSSTVWAATCFNPTEDVEVGGTRDIGNVSTTIDYCRYRAVRECKETSDSDCQQWIKQKCSQVEANCRALWDGTAATQYLNEDEMSGCLVECCEVLRDIIYGKKLLSVDDVITFLTAQPSFDKRAAFFVLEAAAKEVREKQICDPDDPLIFAGIPMECSRSVINVKDCCDTGSSSWAKGIVLHCEDDERRLANARKAGQAVEAGDGNNEYCHNKILGVCTSYHEGYCIFDSKFARIVQQEGRKKQLGISFGDVGDDYAHPNCRGISINELKRLDFSKMDFNGVYAAWPESCCEI
jgi:conjugal transfer mating pair stabilization protein TraN